MKSLNVILYLIVCLAVGCTDQLEVDSADSPSKLKDKNAQFSQSALQATATAHPYWYFMKGHNVLSLYYAYSDDGINWGGDQMLRTAATRETQNSNFGPAAAYFNDKFIVVYANSDAQNLLYRTTSTDGLVWTSKRSMQGSASRPPSLLKHNGKLYVFYRNNTTSGEIMYSETSDGSTWTTPISFTFNNNPLTSTTEVSIVSYNSVFYLFYAVNESGKARILYRTSADLVNWSQSYYFCDNPTSCGIYFTSDKGVTALVHNGQLQIIYKESNGQLYRVLKDSNCLGCWYRYAINGSTSERPSAISFDGKITVVFRGQSVSAVHSSYSLNGYNWFDGNRAIGLTNSGPWVISAVN